MGAIHTPYLAIHHTCIDIPDAVAQSASPVRHYAARKHTNSSGTSAVRSASFPDHIDSALKSIVVFDVCIVVLIVVLLFLLR
jgi:hypothetical protein